MLEELFDKPEEKNPDKIYYSSVSEFITSIPEDKLTVVYDLIKEKLQEDHAERMAVIPDLANEQYNVFDNRKVDKITPKVMEIRQRRYTAFVYYYSHFDRTDDQMISFITMCNPGLSYIEALRDLSNIKLVIGNMPRARKELIRYQVIEMHKRAYQKALEKDNELGMTTAAANIGKAATLDKDDLDIPWELLMPPKLEPTDDISVTGRIPVKNLDAKIESMKKKYLSEPEDAVIVNDKSKDQ